MELQIFSIFFALSSFFTWIALEMLVLKYEFLFFIVRSVDVKLAE
jgi:hypothetical protein